MDISKKYIKMCEQAKEIQERLNPIIKSDYCLKKKFSWKEVSCEKGDYISVKGDRYYSGIYLYGCNGFRYDRHYHNHDEYCWQIDNGNTTDYIDKKACIVWLPRQDQLQDMIKSSTCTMNLLGIFDDFIGSCLEANIPMTVFKKEYENMTMEQLWLACVMDCKYNKSWNDKKKDWTTK